MLQLEAAMPVRAYRRPLAELVDHLFRTVRQQDGTPYSYEQAAKEITERGTAISHTTLWRIRTGKTDDLSVSHLAGIADFFGVDLAYFFDEIYAAKIDAELELRVAMQNVGVRKVAMRAMGLSSMGVESLTKIINVIREMEGLPPFESEADTNTQP
ncbi:helix-turn-helix domain-containing protein [Streptosporangium sp. NPDC000396]|uniref:helix-turn-helix domain-containing protein n=1 Tax=Streptosporangium sp. NPDC000396 TaxID=3366185 RepID=UPI0036BBAB55